MRDQLFFILCILLLFGSCSISRHTQNSVPENIEFILLQMNDVYEIAPLEGGKAGGLARVARVKKELIQENPNTLAILSGDFLSPSFVGNLRMENGEKIAGLQMVETLNALGLDYVTFGNHEFDIDDPVLLQKRIDQSEFTYTVCNASFSDGESSRPFTQTLKGQKQNVPPYVVHEFADRDGNKIRLGLLGVVLPFNKADYVVYQDVRESFRKTYEELRSQVDVVVAITHLNEDEDLALAEAVPGIPLFLGGHDHHHMSHYVENTIITKADANAKTVYIHRITYNPTAKMTAIRSTLKKIDDTIAEDPATAAVVKKWTDKADKVMIDMGYQPQKVLMETKEPLICTESIVRSRPTNYGDLTVSAFAEVLPGADVYLINSGSMRLDDNIFGAVTEYDVLRTFPYGGPIVQMELNGQKLKQVLDVGLIDNRTEGGYFQIKNVSKNARGWLIEGEAIKDDEIYKIVLPKFVAEGRENNLEMLGDYSFEEKASFSVDGQSVQNDIRDIVIWYMSKN